MRLPDLERLGTRSRIPTFSTVPATPSICSGEWELRTLETVITSEHGPGNDDVVTLAASGLVTIGSCGTRKPSTPGSRTGGDVGRLYS
eukprot:5112285-Pyramimonas_sp.AAC.1